MHSYCVHAFALKMNGTRADGSTLLSKNGAPVYSAFFQQSSFGTFALTQERYAVNVRKMPRSSFWVRWPAAVRPGPGPSLMS